MESSTKQQEPIHTNAITQPTGLDRMKGTVKFFNSVKGYGFIVPENAPWEVFVHHTAIVNDGGFRSLAEDEVVEFDVLQGPKGMQATNVTGPDGTPVHGDPEAKPTPKPANLKHKSLHPVLMDGWATHTSSSMVPYMTGNNHHRIGTAPTTTTGFAGVHTNIHHNHLHHIQQLQQTVPEEFIMLDDNQQKIMMTMMMTAGGTGFIGNNNNTGNQLGNSNSSSSSTLHSANPAMIASLTGGDVNGGGTSTAGYWAYAWPYGYVHIPTAPPAAEALTSTATPLNAVPIDATMMTTNGMILTGAMTTNSPMYASYNIAEAVIENTEED